MSLPTVAIVGRPNVGKSSLLNALAGRRIAIVDPTPGVTRDRISIPCAIGVGKNTRYVQLVDTGGMGVEDMDNLTAHVEAQIAYGVEEASLILFVVDAREGITPLDRLVSERLRRVDTPVLLLANKVDQVNVTSEIGELSRLGFGEPLPISAAHSQGLADLRDTIQDRLGKLAPKVAPASVMKLAIVGKRNAGKSTFINSLAGEDRVIVSETPGTTRDSVDVRLDVNGQAMMLIDTAGIRKRRKVSQDIEFYSLHRAMRSIRRADVVALFIDASVPVSQVDRGLAGEIAQELKPVLLVVNKWDLAQGKAATGDYADYFAKTFPQFAYAPISVTTATEGINVHETVDLARQLYNQSRHRVTTADVNVAVQDILQLRGPSHKSGTKPPRILYASQIGTAPPTIVFFVNDVRSFDTSYQRFLVNQLRTRLPFPEVPIRLIFRRRRSTKRDGD